MPVPVSEPRTDTRRVRPLVAGARLTPNEMNRLKEFAVRRGESVSGVVRDLILEATSH